MENYVGQLRIAETLDYKYQRHKYYRKYSIHMTSVSHTHDPE